MITIDELIETAKYLFNELIEIIKMIFGIEK